MDRLGCLLKFVLFVNLGAAASGARAQTAVAVPDAPALTEAQRCEQSLAEVHDEGLAKRLKSIENNDRFVAMTIEAMKQSGQITDIIGERRVTAKLKLGAYFSRTGLLHEAIYQTFKDRYKSNDQIAEALRGFAQISRAADQGVLISEVIERVLQYIPDVTGENLNKITGTAAFLGMNQTQMQEFYTKWVEYDKDDDYADTLQGGILAILTSANEQMIAGVQERSGWIKRKLSGWKVIEVPARPTPVNPDLTVRQVRIEDRGFYDDDQLLEYLKRSSTAARRYFISVRSNVLTRAQLTLAIDNEEAWYLKPELVKDLKRELKWRNALVEKYKILASREHSRRDAELALARLENRATFDQRQVQLEVGQMRLLKTPAEVLAKARTILADHHVVVDSKDFVNIVLSITSNAGPLIGDRSATVALVDEVVKYANLIGVVPDHANKLIREMTTLADRVPGLAAATVRNSVARITPTSPQYEGQSIEQVQTALSQLNAEVERLRDELNQLYAAGF